MNRSLPLALAFAASVCSASLFAQAPAAAPSAAASAAPAAAVPQAVPAKIAVIAFEQAVIATNEGLRSLADLKKKYEPLRSNIET